MTAGVVIAALAAGVLGALARYGAIRLLDRRAGADRVSPALLLVNAGGSLVAGAVIGAALRLDLDPAWTTILVTGFAGGLTTFSTWSVRTVEHARRGRWGVALAEAAAGLGAGTAAAAVGFVGAQLWPA